MSFYGSDFDWIDHEARMYDPSLGRCLSADPILQNPTSVQGHNRYSYVLNNPLKYTDPSGYKVKPAGWDAPWESSAYVNFGPKGGSLSGNYWAVDYRTTEGNWAAMSQSTFDNLYGAGKYEDCYEDIRINVAASLAEPGNFVTYSWNPNGGREISRENTENGVNIYYEGSLSWISNGKYKGREINRSDAKGAGGYGAAAYWLGTVNTLYEMHESKNLANNIAKAKAYRSVAGTVPKSMSISISYGKTMTTVAKTAGRGLFVISTAMTVYDMASNPTRENLLLGSADIIMSVVSIGCPIVGLVYFTGRIVYDITSEE